MEANHFAEARYGHTIVCWGCGENMLMRIRPCFRLLPERFQSLNAGDLSPQQRITLHLQQLVGQ